MVETIMLASLLYKSRANVFSASNEGFTGEYGPSAERRRVEFYPGKWGDGDQSPHCAALFCL